MIDPIRYPKVMKGYEESFKSYYALELQKALIDVTKKVVEVLK